MSDQIQFAKDGAKQILGEKRTADLKRILGRTPSPEHQRARVRISDRIVKSEGEPLNLALVSEVTGQDFREQVPVEHVMPGTSERYRERRLEIVQEFYDVVA